MQRLHPNMREVAVLQAASEMVLSSMDADAVLHQMLLVLRNYFEISHCAVLLADHGTGQLHLSAQLGFDGDHKYPSLRIGLDGAASHAAQLGAPVYIHDVAADPRYLQVHPAVKSQLCLPLIVRDQVAGVLDLESDHAEFFTDEMIGLLALFAGQAAVALDNARLYSTERKRMRQIEFVNLIARSSTTASSMDQLLHTVADLLADTFDGADAIVLLRTGAGAFDVAASTEKTPLDPERLARSLRDGLLQKALLARACVLAENDDHLLVPQCPSEMAVPLVSLGETIGALIIASKKRAAFSPEDRSIAQAIADVCATAVRNVQLSEELRRVTNTDPLTGVYNQRYLHFSVSQELARCRRAGSSFSVVGLDLRDFKRVNADRGFHAGDELLRSVAARLRSTLRSVDIVCRHEADRFAIVLQGIDGDKAEIVERKLRSAIAELQPAGSVAAVVQYPADGDSELKLLRTLFNRLQQAKHTNAGAASAT